MKTMQMNRIGLDEDQVVTLARRLNELLGLAFVHTLQLLHDTEDLQG